MPTAVWPADPEKLQRCRGIPTCCTFCTLLPGLHPSAPKMGCMAPVPRFPPPPDTLRAKKMGCMAPFGVSHPDADTHLIAFPNAVRTSNEKGGARPPRLLLAFRKPVKT